MKLDIATLAFIASLIFATETVAVFVQYRVNKTYMGLGWWLSGAVLQSLGFFENLNRPRACRRTAWITKKNQ